MSARDAILKRIRAQATAGSGRGDRAKAVADRLAKHPHGVIPQRGQLEPAERVKLFIAKAEGVQATVQSVKSGDDVPKAVATYLRSRNLPASIRIGGDKRLKAMPWDKQKALEVKTGPSDGDDLAGVSHGLCGIAETGTLMLTSGPDNPTTINFLPEHHIVVVDAADVEGTLEDAFARLRKASRRKGMPRAVNLVTGPSRSGDVEQKIILGAHGPKALHILVVGKAK
ncbi:lactate utilization protein [Zhengella mangrovi]|uniref:Lactate utilization protein n=1 Tax=Zhengella mangrovi TaxID=1982044 RepID=A0A2G1QL65_9HYPH|nr:lactate utilization protein [Zhengella mangrovi]PHP66242.1 lactate utilization protein [Zhengella mangrovi]